MASATPTPVVYVVDDDFDVLESLRFLLETDGFNVRTFRNASALLNGSVVAEADCFVIDYKMPATSGIELANCLRNRHFDTPIILIRWGILVLQWLRMRYGPGSSWERHDDRGDPSSDTA